MKIPLIILTAIFKIILISSTFCFGSENIQFEAKNEIINVWHEFIDAVENNDTDKITKLSGDKIRCYLCLENTQNELNEINLLRDTDPNWYSKIYNDKIYIPVKNFINDDIKIIFTNKFINLMKTSETFYVKRIIENQLIYEVIVTTSERGEIAPSHEGGQHVFSFERNETGYKFVGIGTIP